MPAVARQLTGEGRGEAWFCVNPNAAKIAVMIPIINTIKGIAPRFMCLVYH